MYHISQSPYKHVILNISITETQRPTKKEEKGGEEADLVHRL